jgi:hypothetical protein
VVRSRLYYANLFNTRRQAALLFRTPRDNKSCVELQALSRKLGVSLHDKAKPLKQFHELTTATFREFSGEVLAFPVPGSSRSSRRPSLICFDALDMKST